MVISPATINELALLLQWLHEKKVPYVMVGSTSNLLFSDDGLRAVMIQLGYSFNEVTLNGSELTAGAGIWVPSLARKAMQAGLTGLEHTCGIPGTLGGLIYMNGGSQRQGIGQSIKSVTSINEKGEIFTRSKEQCNFTYRGSVYQEKNEIIVQAIMKLEKTCDKSSIRKDMLHILQSRRRKFPSKQPNCGSVFVSNPAMYDDYGPPGKVIEQSGFKGHRIGGAVVSDQHANFIVNENNAKAGDVIQLINKIREKVYIDTGYEMAVEARFVDPLGKIENI